MCTPKALSKKSEKASKPSACAKANQTDDLFGAFFLVATEQLFAKIGYSDATNQLRSRRFSLKFYFTTKLKL